MIVQRLLLFPATLIATAGLATALSRNTAAEPGDSQKTAASALVLQIQRADYEGDRDALKRLHEELSPFEANPAYGVKVRYWRAFALWRRAINGFNDGTPRPELKADLDTALAEFEDAARRDPKFADAKIGALGCLSLIGYILIENGSQMHDTDVQKVMADMRQMRHEVETLAPQNPRLLWVMGPNVWKSPPQRGGGEEKALEMYDIGLKTIRQQKPVALDVLEPSWGEPELLMNRAYLNLHRRGPNLDSAEHDAQAALKLVPYWHYVRDILLPQIRNAMTQRNSRH